MNYKEQKETVSIKTENTSQLLNFFKAKDVFAVVSIEYKEFALSLINVKESENIISLIENFKLNENIFSKSLNSENFSRIKEFISNFDEALKAETLEDFDRYMKKYTDNSWEGISFYSLHLSALSNLYTWDFIEAESASVSESSTEVVYEIVDKSNSKLSEAISKILKVSDIANNEINKSVEMSNKINDLKIITEEQLDSLKPFIEVAKNLVDNMSEDEFEKWNYWVSLSSLKELFNNFDEIEKKVWEMKEEDFNMNWAINNSIANFIWKWAFVWENFESTFDSVSKQIKTINNFYDWYNDGVEIKIEQLNQIASYITIMIILYNFTIISDKINWLSNKGISEDYLNNITDICENIENIYWVKINKNDIFKQIENINNLHSTYVIEDKNADKKWEDILWFLFNSKKSMNENYRKNLEEIKWWSFNSDEIGWWSSNLKKEEQELLLN